MKSFLRSLLCRSLSPLLRTMRRDKAAILMFHGFTDEDHVDGSNQQHKHLHARKFDDILTFLKRHYRVISLEDLVECLRANRALPPRAVVLTFDDGFLSNYTLAFPLLQRHQVPAIVYLATEFVDEKKPIWTDRIDFAFHAAGKSHHDLMAEKRRLKAMPQEDVEPSLEQTEAALGQRLERSNAAGVPAIYHSLNWDQVREMQSSGLVQFGAHTHTHKILGRCRPETIRKELEISKHIIERETGVNCRHFCYPNGRQGDFSDVSEGALSELGFVSSLTTVSGWVKEPRSPFLLPRLGISNDLSVPRLNLMMAGFNALLGQQ